MIVECKMNILDFATQMFKLISLHKNNKDIICKLDGLVQLNNKLDKSLYCCNKILLYFITELVFTFLFLKYQNHFEFLRVVRSPCSKILEILGGRWVLKDTLERKILGGGDRYGYFLEPHIILSVTGNLRPVNKTHMQHIFRNNLDNGQRIS